MRCLRDVFFMVSLRRSNNCCRSIYYIVKNTFCSVWAPLAALTLLSGLKRGRILPAPPRLDIDMDKDKEEEEGTRIQQPGGEKVEEVETIYLGEYSVGGSAPF
jgi:hypothetical protein